MKDFSFCCPPLSADIEHLEVKPLEGELSLDDPGRLHTGSQNVFLGGNVMGRCDPRKEKKLHYSNWLKN